MFGAIGGALGGAISSTMESSKGKALADGCALPDFSQLVLAGFVERLERDCPDLPKPVLKRPLSLRLTPAQYQTTQPQKIQGLPANAYPNS